MESRVHNLDVLRGPWDGRDREGVPLVRLRTIEASRIGRASHERENFSRACSGRVPCCLDSATTLASERLLAILGSHDSYLRRVPSVCPLFGQSSRPPQPRQNRARRPTLRFFLLHDNLFSTTLYDFSYCTMGFFQKFLSFGSRRNKKRRAALSTETRYKHPLSREDARRQNEEQEDIANSLLRSSSLRYAVVKEVDYSSLPPLREYSLACR
jgi:hypothetical protein